MGKLIITVATTGGFQGKEANPNLPEQPEEIAQQAYDAYNAGAAILHIHVRDKEGKPTADPTIISDVIRRVKERCNIVIQVSTGVGPDSTVDERINAILTKPEMASLNMGTMVRTRWGEGSLFLNTRSQIEYYVKTMLEHGVKPEMEVYSHPMLVDVQNLIDKGLVKKPYCINFVLGMTHQGALEAKPKNLLSLIDFLPPDSVFSVTGVGHMQTQLITLGMILGGNVRVGMEDNVWYSKGVLASNNAQLVERAARIAKEIGREIASPDEARQILGLRT